MITKKGLKVLWNNPKLFAVKLTDIFILKIALIKAVLSPNKRPDFDSYPIVYIKTPKCASTAIVSALSSLGLVINMLDPKNKAKLLTEAELKKKIICIGSYTNKIWFKQTYPEIWKKSYKWAVVRHPYSKTVSAWKYLSNLRDIPLIEILKNPPSENENFRDYLHFTMTQTRMLFDENGNLEVDCVLKFENLTTDWEHLKSILNYDLPNLQVINKTANKSMSKSIILEEDVKALIRNNYREDFLNFKFD